ncbi:MAG: class E sortase [Ilumatobacteraceae bacterium]
MADLDPNPAPVGRVRKFDRPPPPKDWRWWVSGVGKVLIATGLLMFGFVAYQLWGTAIETARAQNALENEFDELLAGTAPSTTVITSTPPSTAPLESIPVDSVPVDSVPAETVPVQDLPPIAEGDPVARLEIPTMGVDHIVVAGVSKGDLKKGPGHYPDTPMPGQLGNAAIAAHRTTYGQPFYDIDKVSTGDEIVVTTVAGRFVYRVTGQQIVSPSDYYVVATVDPTRATLTLTSCHPKYTARERYVVTAEFDEAASSAPAGQAELNYGRPVGDGLSGDDLPGDETAAPADSVVDSVPDPTSTVVAEPIDDPSVAVDPDGPSAAEIDEGISDAFSDGWFSDPGANSQVALWGLLLAAIGIGSYLISRKARRDWVGAMVGIVPFAVTLYFFFQNVNRLLPPNL